MNDSFKLSSATVSVIIPSYYRHVYLKEVLAQLCRQTVPALEVIVPDQTPPAEIPDGFYDEFSGRLPLTVIHVDEPSISAPRNLAARRAKGDVLLFLDDDVVINAAIIESHLRVMRREAVDVVNGAVTLRERLPEEYPWKIEDLDPVRFFLAAPNHHWQGMMLGVSSCNFSIKRTTFLKVGGFDEKLPRMVDFELGYRLFRSGAKIYFSDEPFARHLRAPGGSRKKPQNHNKLVAALYIHRKHFPGWITTQFMLKTVAGACFQSWTFRTPAKVVVNAFRFFLARREVDRLLRKARPDGSASGRHAPSREAEVSVQVNV